MTPFIDSFSNQQLLPPWQSRGLRMWSFVIKVDRVRIQTHLDLRFNSGGPDLAPYRYDAMDGVTFGLLCVVSHPDFSSMADGVQGWDTVSHREVYWSFPAWRSRITPDNLLVERTLVWIQPFAFDDNSYLMFSVREIAGTEMEMAKIRLAEGSSAADLRVDMAIEGLVQFDPRSQSHQIGLLRIRMQPGARDADLAPLLEQDADLTAFVNMLISMGIFTQGGVDAEGNVQKGMEINTLKQFRDVFDMDVAAYRALVASRTVHSGIADIAFYAGDDTVLEFLRSDSMNETLDSLLGKREISSTSLLGDTPPEFGTDYGGTTTDWNMPHMRVPVALTISYTADARYDVLEVLHTYGQHA